MWITKATGGEKPKPIFSICFAFFSVRAITLALATNNCVVRFSRFSPLIVLFCPSHDGCLYVLANEQATERVCMKRFTVLFTQHK